jgi:hypothetical protein
MGDAQHLTGATRILAIFGCAATADLALAFGVPQMQRDADEIVALLAKQRSRDGRVDPTAHGDQDTLAAHAHATVARRAHRQPGDGPTRH